MTNVFGTKVFKVGISGIDHSDTAVFRTTVSKTDVSVTYSLTSLGLTYSGLISLSLTFPGRMFLGRTSLRLTSLTLKSLGMTDSLRLTSLGLTSQKLTLPWSLSYSPCFYPHFHVYPIGLAVNFSPNCMPSSLLSQVNPSLRAAFSQLFVVVVLGFVGFLLNSNNSKNSSNGFCVGWALYLLAHAVIWRTDYQSGPGHG